MSCGRETELHKIETRFACSASTNPGEVGLLSAIRSRARHAFRASKALFDMYKRRKSRYESLKLRHWQFGLRMPAGHWSMNSGLI